MRLGSVIEAKISGGGRNEDKGQSCYIQTDLISVGQRDSQK
jgi:hypothetical protein